MKRVRKKADGKNTTSHMSTTEETPRKVTSRLETMYWSDNQNKTS